MKYTQENRILINNPKDDYEYTYFPILIIDEELSPLLELKRYQIIRELANELKIYFQKKGYSIEFKSCFGFILQFIFENFKKQTFISTRDDPLFPKNGHYEKGLRESFFFILQKYHIKENDFISFQEDFNLSEKCNKIIEELKEFKKSPFFQMNKMNYRFERRNLNQMYDLITINYIIDSHQKGDIDIFKISIRVNPLLIKKLENQNQIYCKQNKIDFQPKVFENLLACLLIRYETIQAGNEQLACNPEFYFEMKKRLGFDFEMFGSAINTQYHQFGSLFYDIEKYFLSKGSFYGIECKRGKYVANPPFVNEVIEEMALKMIRNLDDTKNKRPLSFFITIPGWESNEEYGEYSGFEIMKKSKYFSYFKEIPKEESRFFDYNHNRIIYPCKIFFILFENELAKEEYHMKNEIEEMIKTYFIPPQGNEYQYVPKIIENIIELKGGYIDKHKMDMMVFEFDDKKKKEDEERMNSFIVNEICFPHEKKYKIKKNIKLIEDGYDYETKEAKQYYKKASIYNTIDTFYPKGTSFRMKKSKKEKEKKPSTYIPYSHITNYTFYAFQTIFKDITQIDKLCLIDLTRYCGTNDWIFKRLNIYYDEIMKHLLKKNVFVTTDCKILYRAVYSYEEKNKNKLIDLVDEKRIKTKTSEYDFLIMTGSLGHSELSQISYFKEQINVYNFFIQILMLFNLQKRGGSFIFIFYTADTKPIIQLLSLLHSYYDILCIEKITLNKDTTTSLSYLFGKGFKDISKVELNKLYSIFDSIINIYKNDLGDEVNIFDMKKRKKYNVFKYIKSSQHNQFISNLFDIRTSKSFEDKLRSYNKTIFKNMIRAFKNNYPVKKKSCGIYDVIDFSYKPKKKKTKIKSKSKK